jgi:cobalt/nickel transport system permease protein
LRFVSSFFLIERPYMHIPDGFISDPINSVTAAATLAALGYGALRMKEEVRKQPLLTAMFAVITTFIFAAQMLNFPIGGGTSGHFLGAVLAASLMGPWAACASLALVLFVQGLFFADGGLMAFGSNVFNMGIVGGVVSYYGLRRLRSFLPEGKAGFLTSVGITSWLSIVLASAACSLQLALSGTVPLLTVMPAMVGTHALIGLGEAAITMLAVAALAYAYPAVMPAWAQCDSSAPSPVQEKSLLASGLAVSLILAMLISPFASAFPDGLEKVAEDKGFIQTATEEAVVWTASPFPDYQVTAIEQESVSTAFAGLIGSLLVFTLAVGTGKRMSRQRR